MHNYFTGKTVLLTGGAGFIGSNLTKRLLELGSRVISIDNFISGREKNIQEFIRKNGVTKIANFSFIQADVSQPVENYLPHDIGVDLILHFASPASPPRYQKKPVETYLVNSIATHYLLDFIKRNNPQARFVFAGTSEAYGDPKVHPQVETYWGNVNPNGARSCYDESKRLGETICGVFHRSFGIDARILRIFNTYGPNMDPNDGRIIPNLVTQALKHDPLTIYGDGSQTRSYCYIDDLIEFILRMSSKDGLDGETINIGNPEEYTVLETAKIIHEIVVEQDVDTQGSETNKQNMNKENSEIDYQDSSRQDGGVNQASGELKLEYKPMPTDDPTKRQPDISKAKKLLGYEPRVSFKSGLKPTIEYFKRDFLN